MVQRADVNASLDAARSVLASQCDAEAILYRLSTAFFIEHGVANMWFHDICFMARSGVIMSSANSSSVFFWFLLNMNLYVKE